MVPIQYKNVKPGLYLIDEYGNVYSNYKKGYMIPTKDKDEYLKLTLSGGSRSNQCYVRVATLVAWHFIGPPIGLIDPTVDHKDGNKENNYYTNLCWLERGINSSIRNNKGEGESNPAAVLNAAKVKEICELLISTSKSYQEIAALFGVDKSTIANIKNKKTWKNITKDYNFSCHTMIRNSLGQFETVITRSD